MANSNPNQSATMAETLNKQEAFFVKYKKAILGGVLALIVIIFGFIAIKNFVLAPREAKASTALAQAQQLFATQQFDKALNGDKAAGKQGFLEIADCYTGTDAANLADLYAGLCYAQLGKWQDAVKYLDDFSKQNDAVISPAAEAALGNAYAHTNQVDKAIDCLKKAADMADSKAEDGINNSLSPIYLIQAARLLESQKKNDDALEIYKDIKAKYVNSAASQDIEKYIERLSK